MLSYLWKFIIFATWFFIKDEAFYFLLFAECVLTNRAIFICTGPIITTSYRDLIQWTELCKFSITVSVLLEYCNEFSKQNKQVKRLEWIRFYCSTFYEIEVVQLCDVEISIAIFFWNEWCGYAVDECCVCKCLRLLDCCESARFNICWELCVDQFTYVIKRKTENFWVAAVLFSIQLRKICKERCLTQFQGGDLFHPPFIPHSRCFWLPQAQT